MREFCCVDARGVGVRTFSRLIVSSSLESSFAGCFDLRGLGSLAGFWTKTKVSSRPKGSRRWIRTVFLSVSCTMVMQP